MEINWTKIIIYNWIGPTKHDNELKHGFSRAFAVLRLVEWGIRIIVSALFSPQQTYLPYDGFFIAFIIFIFIDSATQNETWTDWMISGIMYGSHFTETIVTLTSNLNVCVYFNGAIRFCKTRKMYCAVHENRNIVTKKQEERIFELPVANVALLISRRD